MREVLAQRLLLEKRLSLDLRKLELNELVLLWQASELRKNALGFSLAVVVDEPTWREGHEDHAHTEKDSRNELQAERQKPCGFLLCSACAPDKVCAVVDPETDHDTEGNGQLLETNKCTTYLRRRNLGVVHGNNHGERTDTHTGDETSGKDGVVAGADGCGLDYDTKDEDGNVDENGVFTGEDLSEETGVHGSEPGTKFENGDEPALLGGVPFEVSNVVLVYDVVAHVYGRISALLAGKISCWTAYES